MALPKTNDALRDDKRRLINWMKGRSNKKRGWVSRTDMYRAGHFDVNALMPLIDELIAMGEIEKELGGKSGRTPMYRYTFHRDLNHVPEEDDKMQETATLAEVKPVTSEELLDPIFRVAKELEDVAHHDNATIRDRIEALTKAGEFYKDSVRIRQSIGEVPDADRRVQGGTTNVLALGSSPNAGPWNPEFLLNAAKDEAAKIQKKISGEVIEG